MHWFLSGFIPSSPVMRFSALYSLFPGMHTETNINYACKTISSVKYILWSARNSLVFQLTLSECCRLAHSKGPGLRAEERTKAWGQLSVRRTGKRPLCKNKELTPTDWHIPRAQDQVLRDTLKLGAAVANAHWGDITILGLPAEGEVPEDWRIAYVVPLFKKGNRDNPENYRSEVMKIIDEGKAVDVVYMDFSKAFDK
eukprot:g45790.t1